MQTLVQSPYITADVRRYCIWVRPHCPKVMSSLQHQDCTVRTVAWSVYNICCNAQPTVSSDPCRNVNCPTFSTCQGGRCVCNSGYVSTNGVCTPRNPCQNVRCQAYSSCVSGACVCNSGYVLSNGVCRPRDPCANVNCPSLATCQSGTCVCQSGYVMTNGVCRLQDPCANVNCPSLATCQSGTCVCPSGYVMTNGVCRLPDPCLNVRCPSLATCRGGTCQCISGYVLINGVCQSQDPCQNVNCQSFATCQSGVCVCNSGYVSNNGVCVPVTTTAPSSGCPITPLQPRIVGGVDATECEFPWLVGIKRGLYFTCGGSILDSTHILTAAHCVDQSGSFTVQAGKYYTNDANNRYLQEFAVSRITIHQSFDSIRLVNDIAILTLSSSIQFNNCVQPTCLPGAFEQPNYNEQCMVAGWGTIRYGGSQPTLLQKVQLQPYSSSDCRNRFRETTSTVTAGVMCADNNFQGGRDSCQGDSGGPMFCRSSDGSYTQYGIVSSGRGCATAGEPGFYAYVPYYIDWINQMMRNV